MSEVFIYQIGLLGAFAPYKEALIATLEKRFSDLGLNNRDYKILLGSEIRKRNRKAPFSAIFFGAKDSGPPEGESLDAILCELIEDSVVILPVVESLEGFSQQVPKLLENINGLKQDPDDAAFERVVAVILENFRLLRRERRLFISYKRDEASEVAAQLYEALDRRGFDVFLDTQGVPPGKDFQAVLWHRLADSDVVVLLDTPNFLKSRWTPLELARANATNIQILQVLWPGLEPSAPSAMSHFAQLDAASFLGPAIGAGARLHGAVVSEIVIRVEALRARALAARSMYLVDAFCDQVRQKGRAVAVQALQYITVEAPKGPLVVVPLVGVPNALRLHDTQLEIERRSQEPVRIWALYDERGLLDEALAHFDWLNLSLPVVAVKVSEVTSRLDEEFS